MNNIITKPNCLKDENYLSSYSDKDVFDCGKRIRIIDIFTIDEIEYLNINNYINFDIENDLQLSIEDYFLETELVLDFIHKIQNPFKSDEIVESIYKKLYVVYVTYDENATNQTYGYIRNAIKKHYKDGDYIKNDEH